MGTVPRKPSEVKQVDFAMDELVGALQRAVRTRVDEAAPFEAVESRALAITNEMVRRFLGQTLQQIADGHGAEVKIEGQRYKRHQPGEVSYHSLCGPLLVRRWTHRQAGERNSATVVPLELAAGIVERATPALAGSVAHGYALGTMRDREKVLQLAHRAPPSRTTLERMAIRIGSEAKRVVDSIEPALRRNERIPDGARGISIGLDRTSVPMEEDKPPDDVEVHYRMAYVGTVSVTDKDGETLVARRYAAAAHEGPDGLIRRMMADLAAALGQKPRLNVLLVQDAAPELWRLMEDALEKEKTVRSYYGAIDRYHLHEHLSALLEVLEQDQARRHALFEHWKRRLDKSDVAIDYIARWCHEKAKQLSHARFMAAYPHLNYLGLAHSMRYATLRKLGLPVGSGVTEGACKYLIMARTKRSGQRWRPTGIDAVLALRSLEHSERLPGFWKRFSGTYRTPINMAA